jgi:hypothetical protein
MSQVPSTLVELLRARAEQQPEMHSPLAEANLSATKLSEKSGTATTSTDLAAHKYYHQLPRMNGFNALPRKRPFSAYVTQSG